MFKFEKEEYRANYEKNYEYTKYFYNQYMNMKNTFSWKLLLLKFKNIDPIDIVNVRIKTNSLYETINELSIKSK